jgi:predicted nucleotidyltransferase
MPAIDQTTQDRLQRAVAIARQHVSLEAAYFFGSRSRGQGDKWSDLDLAFFIKNAESWTLQQRTWLTVEVQKKAGDDIEPHFFSAKALREPSKQGFESIVLAEGIRL